MKLKVACALISIVPIEQQKASRIEHLGNNLRGAGAERTVPSLDPAGLGIPGTIAYYPQYLNAKNQRSLECKQKRYRNLEAREHKAMLSLGTVGAGSEGDTKLGNRRQASSVHEGKENVVLPRLGNGNNRCSVGLGRR